MNKEVSLDISFSFVTLSEENTNIRTSGKEGDPWTLTLLVAPLELELCRRMRRLR